MAKVAAPANRSNVSTAEGYKMNMHPHLRRALCRFAAVSIIAAMLAAPAVAYSAQEYTEEETNPFKILYDFMYPVGKGLEYAVTRPLHAAAEQIAPFEHIDERRPNECLRERPSRNCTRSVHR